MKKLLLHIEYLLQERSHVIVPDFGVFICEHKSAEIRDNGQIIPPYSEICFNNQIQHSDNSLAESIAYTDNVSVEEATDYIAQSVKELKWTLALEGSLAIGSIGSLIFENSCYSFVENRTALNMFNQFGLPVCSLKTLPAQPIETKEPVISETKEKIHISVNKRTLRYVASTAAAILIFLLFSSPVSKQSTNINYAGIISSEIFQQKQLVKLADSIAASTRDSVSATETPQLLSEKKNATPAPVIQKTEVIAEVKSPDKYYIIVNSFPEKREGENHLSKLLSMGHTSAGILHNGGRSRIYLKSFPKNQRQEAQNELNQIRKDSKFKDAWVYALN